MSEGDFRSNEKSITLASDDTLKIEFTAESGEKKTLKDNLKVLEGEVVDATVMSKKALLDFLRKEVKDAKEKDVLFSLHMKATMMKVSDPIIFGHAVEVFFKDVFEKYGDELDKAGADQNNGLGDVLSAIESFLQIKNKKLKQRSQKILKMDQICYGKFR